MISGFPASKQKGALVPQTPSKASIKAKWRFVFNDYCPNLVKLSLQNVADVIAAEALLACVVR